MAVPNPRDRSRMPTARGTTPALMPPPAHRAHRPLIELKRTPASGLGIFALHPIRRGTRVLTETPILSINDSSPAPATAILTAFHRLPPAKQSLFLTLYRFADPVTKLGFATELDVSWASLEPLARDVLTTWCANALSTGVYVTGSRFNHGCAPNTYTTHNAALGARTFHAVREISRGEELTISYIDFVYRHKEYRLERLGKWDFTCACVACGETLAAGRGETKRLKIYQCEQELAEAVSLGEWKDVVDAAVKMGDLQVQIGSLGWELGATCLEGARAHLMLGDIQEAIRWMKRVLEVNTRCAGADHPAVGQVKRVITRMEAAMRRGGYVVVGDSVLKWFDRICGAKRGASELSSEAP